MKPSKKVRRKRLYELFVLLLVFCIWGNLVSAQSHSGQITHDGWYRIAQNGTTLGGTNGNRASAHFILTDKTASLHQTVEFLAYIHFNKMPSLTVLNNSYYGTVGIPFSKIRILVPNGVYNGSAVEVYVHVNGTNDDAYYMEDNDQASGWTAVQWQSVSTASGDNDGVPAGYTACVMDLQNLVTGYVTKTGRQYSNVNGNFYTSGNILLGKTTQTNSAYKLDIEGKARANEIIVTSTGADFVFDSTYVLPELAQVERYTRQFHHLPGVASAAEMRKEGLKVGENQTKLLQKIEELTLYLLAQEKKLAAQSQQITQLKEAQQALKRQNQRLESLQTRLQILEKDQTSQRSPQRKNKAL